MSQLGGTDRVDTTLGVADSTVWRALFPDTLGVKGFEFKDLNGHLVLSYDSRALHALIRQLYSKCASRVDEQLPGVSEYFNDSDWKRVVDVVHELDREFSDLAFRDEGTGLRRPDMQFESYWRTRLEYDNEVKTLLARL